MVPEVGECLAISPLNRQHYDICVAQRMTWTSIHLSKHPVLSETLRLKQYNLLPSILESSEFRLAAFVDDSGTHHIVYPPTYFGLNPTFTGIIHTECC